MRDNLGHTDRSVIQLAIMLFTLILISNWLELIPSGEWLIAPTADLNMTLALALIVIVGVHARSIRCQGLRGYVKHYFQPIPVLFPLNIIEESSSRSRWPCDSSATSSPAASCSP